MVNPITDTMHTASGATNTATSGGLKKQVGPLPVGVWIAVIGGALLISFYLRRKSAATTANGTSTTAPSALVYTGTGGTDTPSTTVPTTGSGFQTNEAWAQAAKQYLISQGVDSKAASDAVDLYINAQMLDATQNARIAVAIRALGPPPQSLPPTTGGTTPPVTPGGTGNVWGSTPRNYPASIMGTTYTVKDGDTLLKIASSAYALNTKDYSSQQAAVNEILNANHDKISDVYHVAPGTSLYIPVLSQEQFPGFGRKIPTFTNPKDATHSGDWLVISGAIPKTAVTQRQNPV